MRMDLNERVTPAKQDLGNDLLQLGKRVAPVQEDDNENKNSVPSSQHRRLLKN